MEVRDKILKAATELYAETGFRGTTTRQIAQLAGVNEVTVFRHFGSKTALIQEVVRTIGAPVRTYSARRPSGPGRPILFVMMKSSGPLAHNLERSNNQGLSLQFFRDQQRFS